MSSCPPQLQAALRQAPRTWLVTGAAGFIGANLVEALLQLDQRVVGLDNFATGLRQTLADVRATVGEAAWQRFEFLEGDITDLAICQRACRDSAIVLHQAALGSVPRSIADPLTSHRANVDGFLNMLIAARDTGVQRFVYAGSSSTYGDHPGLPKVEHVTGRPLSPYAVTKWVDEVYAEVFARTYGVSVIGLRYFNVFGRRQRPDGPYAAVIPRWIASLLQGEPGTINGDGETSRDFCYVDNVVQANLLAGTSDHPEAANQVYNVACGQRTSLNELYALIQAGLAPWVPQAEKLSPRYQAFRDGDVRHSLADIGKAQRLLGYQPSHSLAEGLTAALPWYVAQAADSRQA
ncbi:MAG: SDR family oxidoreductase [Candidatus Sericytochromatia bacterium]|nr:SDR family oxidoreductase [Candidatus Sericytochromatia bacterium]